VPVWVLVHPRLNESTHSWEHQQARLLKYHERVCQHTHVNNKRATSGSVDDAEENVSEGTSRNVKIICGPNREGRKRKAKSIITTALDR